MKNLPLEASQADAAAIHAMTDQQLDRHVAGQVSVFRNIDPDKVLKEAAYAAYRWAWRAFEAAGLSCPSGIEKLATGQYSDNEPRVSSDPPMVPMPADDDLDQQLTWADGTPLPDSNGKNGEGHL